MKKHIVLSIDTSFQDTAAVALEIDGTRYEKISQSRVMKAQMVLPLIETLLNEHHVNQSDITEIQVNEGPGSFTGLRVGIAIANMLGTLLKIPINGTEPPILPTYDKDW